MYILNKLISQADNGSLIKTTPDGVRRGGGVFNRTKILWCHSLVNTYTLLLLRSSHQMNDAFVENFAFFFDSDMNFYFFTEVWKEKKEEIKKGKSLTVQLLIDDSLWYRLHNIPLPVYILLPVWMSWSPRVRRVTLPTEWAFVNPVKQSYSKVPRTVHFKHNSLYPCRFSVCFILW